jgi:peptidoglycan hydrolase CwlO-like protein
MGNGIYFIHSVDNYGAVFTSHNSQSAVLYGKGRSAPLTPKHIDLLKSSFNTTFDGSGRDYDISGRVEKILSVYDERDTMLKETEAAKAELVSMRPLLHSKTEELKVAQAELASMRPLLHSKTEELKANAATIALLKVEHAKETAELNSRVRTTVDLLESMSRELARLQQCEEELIRLKQIETRQLREAAFEREMVERRLAAWKHSTTNATALNTVESNDDPK